ncbi:hypothetical protein HWV62_37735 [Athelia sp. TMB]|nr:hypothetical protein HWV62_37735 [Athelia sp. TMB]
MTYISYSLSLADMIILYIHIRGFVFLFRIIRHGVAKSRRLLRRVGYGKDRYGCITSSNVVDRMLTFPFDSGVYLHRTHFQATSKGSPRAKPSRGFEAQPALLSTRLSPAQSTCSAAFTAISMGPVTEGDSLVAPESALKMQAAIGPQVRGQAQAVRPMTNAAHSTMQLESRTSASSSSSSSSPHEVPIYGAQRLSSTSQTLVASALEHSAKPKGSVHETTANSITVLPPFRSLNILEATLAEQDSTSLKSQISVNILANKHETFDEEKSSSKDKFVPAQDDTLSHHPVPASRSGPCRLPSNSSAGRAPLAGKQSVSSGGQPIARTASFVASTLFIGAPTTLPTSSHPPPTPAQLPIPSPAVPEYQARATTRPQIPGIVLARTPAPHSPGLASNAAISGVNRSMRNASSRAFHIVKPSAEPAPAIANVKEAPVVALPASNATAFSVNRSIQNVSSSAIPIIESSAKDTPPSLDAKDALADTMIPKPQVISQTQHISPQAGMIGPRNEHVAAKDFAEKLQTAILDLSGAIKMKNKEINELNLEKNELAAVARVVGLERDAALLTSGVACKRAEFLSSQMGSIQTDAFERECRLRKKSKLLHQQYAQEILRLKTELVNSSMQPTQNEVQVEKRKEGAELQASQAQLANVRAETTRAVEVQTTVVKNVETKLPSAEREMSALLRAVESKDGEICDFKNELAAVIRDIGLEREATQVATSAASQHMAALSAQLWDMQAADAQEIRRLEANLARSAMPLKRHQVQARRQKQALKRATDRERQNLGRAHAAMQDVAQKEEQLRLVHEELEEFRRWARDLQLQAEQQRHEVAHKGEQLRIACEELGTSRRQAAECQAALEVREKRWVKDREEREKFRGSLEYFRTLKQEHAQLLESSAALKATHLGRIERLEAERAEWQGQSAAHIVTEQVLTARQEEHLSKEKQYMVLIARAEKLYKANLAMVQKKVDQLKLQLDHQSKVAVE